MIGIYHKKDLDGWCSGAVMRMKYPDIKLIGWDYGMPTPDTPAGESVVVADVSFPMDDMADMAARSGDMTWIDHHVSAMDAADETFGGNTPFTSVLPPREDDGTVAKKAACELSWEYHYPGRPMPRAVQLLGRYDVFRDKDMPGWNEEVLPFQMGMKAICDSPESFPLKLLEEDTEVDDVIRMGIIILAFVNKENKRISKHRAYELDFVGLRVIAMNSSAFSSAIFDGRYDPSMHDAMMCYCYNKDGHWDVSIYSDKPEIDVSGIAVERGGGGHRGAAGFRMSNDQIDSLLLNN